MRVQARGEQEAEPVVVWRPLEAPAAAPPPASDASSNASSDASSQQPSAEQRRAERLRECRGDAHYAALKRAAAAREHAAAEEACNPLARGPGICRVSGSALFSGRQVRCCRARARRR